MKKQVIAVPVGKEALVKRGRGRPSGNIYRHRWVIGLTAEQHETFSAKAREQGKTCAEFARSAMRHYI